MGDTDVKLLVEKLDKKLFTTSLEKEHNTLVINYKGIGCAEVYGDELDIDFRSMHRRTRRTWAWDNYRWLIPDMRPDIMEE